jgi:hydrogenase/urease accessory protein HupE
MLIILAGFLAGFVHVLSGPDHLAAIAPYAVDGKRTAWRTGVRWGFGHASGAFAVGLLVLLLRDVFPVAAVSAWGERLVGVVLVCIGLWGARTALVRARRRRVRSSHHHGHKAFAVGTLHGLAGSAHLLAILPALALPSALAAGAYMVLFGTGSIVAMGTFALVVGWVASRHGASDPRAQSALLGLSSLFAVGVGLYWLYGAT